jgi:hypothetical protein
LTKVNTEAVSRGSIEALLVKLPGAFEAVMVASYCVRQAWPQPRPGAMQVVF